MKLENEFTVDTSVDEVWDVLINLERITPCLPGASLAEETGNNGEYKGNMKVKLGPVTQEYNGTVSIEEADESQHRAVLKANGKDRRGQGTASATIVSTLSDEGNGSTKVHVETDMQLTGRAAQFGGGVQQDVAEKIMSRFAECLSDEIVGGGAEQEVAAESEPSADGAAAKTEEQQQGGDAQQDEGGVEALDLGEASRGAILQRVKPLAPIAVGVGALAAVLWLLRGGSSGTRSEFSGGRSGSWGEIEARIRF